MIENTAGWRYIQSTDSPADYPTVSAHNAGKFQDLKSTVDGKAPSSHTHSISQVTGLDTALAGKAPSSHTHSISQVTGLDTALAGKAPSSHTHTQSQVTGLDAALAGKAPLPTLNTRVPENLALRQDATVGTRIFAGTTMIFGDTGRRRVMPVRNSVTSGSLVVRRVGSVITLFLDNIVPVDPSGPLQNLGLDIPPGFRPDESQVFGLVGNSGSALRSHKLAIYNKIILYIQRDAGWNDTSIVDGGYSGQISYSTTQSWPTSLPGTPA